MYNKIIKINNNTFKIINKSYKCSYKYTIIMNRKCY